MNLFAVVGMHRSGTSIVARMLNLLGADLGPAEDLMPSKPDNPKGFWESLTVTQLHDDLIAELGGRWDQPPVLAPDWESDPRLEPMIARVRAIVESHFASADVAVWKDPRGSLLLPLWRRVVPVTGTIVCVRDPDEVAQSLEARDGLDAERAAALWLRYVVAGWQSDGGHLLVRFDEAYDQPVELMKRLASFVGLPPPTEEVIREVASFVDPSLRHHAPSRAAAGPLMRLARAAHAVMTNEPREVVAPLFAALSEGWRIEAEANLEPSRRDALRGEAGPSVVEILKS